MCRYYISGMKYKYTLVLLLALNVAFAHAQVKPVPHAHAHNDYMHKHPLQDALDNGFTSIEIDVFERGGKLIVSHTGMDVKGEIEELYLKPVQKRIEEYDGTVYKNDNTPVIFMVDFKTGGDTYNTLKKVLEKYKDLLTLYKNGKVVKRRPLSILISGNKPFAEVMAEDTAMVTIDASITQLGEDTYDKVITRYSDPWHKYFKWNGNGEFSANEKAKLDSMVAVAHAKGKHIRFYAIPDKPAVWKVLLAEGVDWVNTDKLEAFRKFEKE